MINEIKIQENIPLSRYTTLKIGGPAKFFCEVKNESELLEAIKYAKYNSLPAFIMGGGSNVLVSDDGFKGLVIRLINQSRENRPSVKMRMENGFYFLECWAGENLSSIVQLTSESSLSGLEWAAGIPGTIGGAVRGNAGAFGSCMADTVDSVKIFDVLDNSNIITRDENQKSKFKIIKNKECHFDYRTSLFKKNNGLILTSVVLKFRKGDKAEIETKIRKILSKRTEGQPRDPSAGSFFKNPLVKNKEILERFERDTGKKSKDGKIPAGWLISEVGLSGKRIGQIQVSEKHANFVVNLGGGKAQDVVMLASLIKQKVRNELEIELFEEVQYVGFN